MVGVRIDNLAGGPVWGTSSRRGGRTIGLIDGPASVDIAIPSLPLLEGVYDLTVALTDHTEVHPYDHLGSADSLRGPPVQVVRHRRRQHPRRVDDHRRTGRRPDRFADAVHAGRERATTDRRRSRSSSSPTARVPSSSTPWTPSSGPYADPPRGDRRRRPAGRRSPQDSRVASRRSPDITLIEVDENLGFSGGNNLGAHHATGELLCFLNPDVVVGPGWLEPLVASLDDPTVGIAAPVLVNVDGSLQEAGQLDVRRWVHAAVGGPEVCQVTGVERLQS